MTKKVRTSITAEIVKKDGIMSMISLLNVGDDRQSNEKAVEQFLLMQEGKRTKKTKIECDEHPKYMIDHFCPYHDAVCCEVCLGIHHRFVVD